MCQPKAATGSTAPAVVVIGAVICAAISSAAAVITGALLVILAVLGVVAAVGVVGLAVLIGRGQTGLWRPAPRRPASVPGLPAARTLAALPAPVPLAIEAGPPQAITAPRAVRGAFVLPDSLSEPARQDEMMPVG